MQIMFYNIRARTGFNNQLCKTFMCKSKYQRLSFI